MVPGCGAWAGWARHYVVHRGLVQPGRRKPLGQETTWPFSDGRLPCCCWFVSTLVGTRFSTFANIRFRHRLSSLREGFGLLLANSIIDIWGARRTYILSGEFG